MIPRAELEANPPPFETAGPPNGTKSASLLTSSRELDKNAFLLLHIRNFGTEVDFDFTLPADGKKFTLDIYGFRFCLQIALKMKNNRYF